MQRFEQEVKLLSHNGVLLLLQNDVTHDTFGQIVSVLIGCFRLI